MCKALFTRAQSISRIYHCESIYEYYSDSYFNIYRLFFSSLYAFVQIITCRLFCDKLLSGTIVAHCSYKTSFIFLSLNLYTMFDHFDSTEINTNMVKHTRYVKDMKTRF